MPHSKSGAHRAEASISTRLCGPDPTTFEAFLGFIPLVDPTKCLEDWCWRRPRLLRRLHYIGRECRVSPLHHDGNSSQPAAISQPTRKPCCRKETARCRKCSFPSKFANDIHYKYKTSHASKAATLQSSEHAGAKHNLTQNQDSKSIKLTCLESVEKTVRQ